MIIAGRIFVLTEPEAAATPLTNARIGYRNYARSDLISAANITVSSEDEKGPRDAPLEPDTAEYWQPTSLPATWRLDLGRLVEVDYVGIAAHTLGTERVALLVETSPDDVTYTPFADEQMPASDAPLLFLLSTLRTIRYLRLTLSGGVGGDEMPRIAVIYVGPMLAMQRAVSGGYTPITMSRETELVCSMSSGGQFLGQEFRSKGVSGSAAFRFLDADWVRTNFGPFVRSARTSPYFFAWNPETFPDEVAFVWTRQDIKPRYMNVIDQMEVSWEMQGIDLE